MGLIAFQSTRPVRGGTKRRRKHWRRCNISIHPPRAGRDPGQVRAPGCRFDFNPPAPCGAGPCWDSAMSASRAFQSTRPVRGGTAWDGARLSEKVISIHPPRAGRDAGIGGFMAEGLGISIHPPRAGRDVYVCRSAGGRKDFNPPAPCGAGP